MQWNFEPKRPGAYRIMARATSQSGASQPLEPIPNPSGYHHNACRKSPFSWLEENMMRTLIFVVIVFSPPRQQRRKAR